MAGAGSDDAPLFTHGPERRHPQTVLVAMVRRKKIKRTKEEEKERKKRKKRKEKQLAPFGGVPVYS